MLSARNYRALARREKNAERRTILERMAGAEERHAETWAKRLRELGAEPGDFSESFVDRVRRWILLRSDTEVAAKMLETGESQADKLYDALMAQAASKQDRSALQEARRDEHTHSRMLEEFEGRPSHHPQRRLDTILGRETWHVRAGG
jgi:rubrerythrin